jgi:hypothetical protein
VVLPATAAILPETPGYPCAATIIQDPSQRLNIVRAAPLTTSPAVVGVTPGETVQVLEESRQNSRIIWYRIARPESDPLGWVEPKYLDFSSSCPVSQN